MLPTICNAEFSASNFECPTCDIARATAKPHHNRGDVGWVHFVKACVGFSHHLSKRILCHATTRTRSNGVGQNVVALQFGCCHHGECGDTCFGGRIICLRHTSKEACARRGGHDASLASIASFVLFAPVSDGVTHRTKCSTQMHTHHSIPFVNAHVDQHAVPHNAGIAHQGIERSKSVNRLRNKSTSTIPIRDVIGVDHCLATHRCDCAYNFLRGCLIGGVTRE